MAVLPKDLVGIKRVTPEQAAIRQKICDRCPHRKPVVNICRKCGCLLRFKTKLAITDCPIGAWPSIVNE